MYTLLGLHISDDNDQLDYHKTVREDRRKRLRFTLQKSSLPYPTPIDSDDRPKDDETPNQHPNTSLRSSSKE